MSDGVYLDRGSSVWRAPARHGSCAGTRRSKRGASDPAGRNGSCHTLLHPPTTGPERGLSIQRRKKARAGQRGDTCEGARGVRRRSAGEAKKAEHKTQGEASRTATE